MQGLMDPTMLLLQAYMMNSWHRQLNARLGKEQEVFAGNFQHDTKFLPHTQLLAADCL